MESIPVFVGLDYHANVVQVCVKDESGRDVGRARLPDSCDRIHEFVSRRGTVRRVAIESCCGAADLAEELTDRFGWSVELGHPGYVNRMRQTPDKSDLTDAQMLADLTRVGYLPRVWIAPRAIRELRVLVRHRQDLAKQRRNGKLRLRAVLREQRVKEPHSPWTLAWLEWLGVAGEISEQGRWVIQQLLAQIEYIEKRIADVERRLRRTTAKDEIVRRLLEEPGIGPVTAWILRAEIGRFDRFRTGKQLARFCGLSPRNASSGERQADAGLVKAGNRHLRAVVIEAAHRLKRHEPRWRALADQLRGRGKTGSQIAAAVANRWMRGLHHRMTSMPA